MRNTAVYYKGALHSAAHRVDAAVDFRKMCIRDRLGDVLFVDLGLPAKKKTKTGYSTNADVLDSLRGKHPIIELILEYRKLSKLKSTYVDGLLKVVGPDGRVRSTFQQTETRTGRISSTEPNLQNIPIRTAEGSNCLLYTSTRGDTPRPPAGCFVACGKDSPQSA